jgi:hypothetical protein
MNSEFITYQIFSHEAEAKDLILCLTKNQIEYKLEDTSCNFALADNVNNFNQELRVKIRKEDFENVDKLMLELSMQINHVPNDYYLFSFTNEELYDIVLKYDEWSKLDYSLAIKVLKERGITVDENMIQALRRQRLLDLAKPEGNQKTWIIAGYVFAFLGGLIGFLIGWHLYTHKKTLPNGTRVFGYSIEDRKHGNKILFIGIFFSILWMVFKLYFSFYSIGINT